MGPIAVVSWDSLQQAIENATGRPWLISLVTVLLLFLIVDLLAWSAARRRTRDVVAAARDSTRGDLRPSARMRTGRVRAAIAPPPDPFRFLKFEFSMEFGGPLRAFLWPVALRRQRLVLSGDLMRQPQAELVWEKGQPPSRALGRGPATLLWVARRLDFLGEEYAVHGANTAPIEHAFADMQRRYGPCTRRIALVREGPAQMVIALSTNRLNAEEISALVTSTCVLARAALRD